MYDETQEQESPGQAAKRARLAQASKTIRSKREQADSVSREVDKIPNNDIGNSLRRRKLINQENALRKEVDAENTDQFRGAENREQMRKFGKGIDCRSPNCVQPDGSTPPRDKSMQVVKDAIRAAQRKGDTATVKRFQKKIGR